MAFKHRKKGYLAYGAGILVFFSLLGFYDHRAQLEAKSRAETLKRSAGQEETDTNSPDRPAKSGSRVTTSKPASDQEVAKFRRFFLPPIKLENALIADAVAAVIAAYREAASATGETAVDLNVDLGAARTRKPITCITPRATAGEVLRYVAALAGNSTKGSLPNFRLTALSDVPDREGTVAVPDDISSQLNALLARMENTGEAKLDADPFAWKSGSVKLRQSVPDLLIAMGLNDSLKCFVDDGKLSYGNISESELALLDSLLSLSSDGGIGPIQLKTLTKVLLVPDSVADPLSSGAILTDGEVQLSMRKFAQTQGVDLMTLPAITARQGEVAKVEIGGSGSSREEAWTGVRMATTAVPYGLGSQVEFALQVRAKEDGEVQAAREQITVPENGSGVAISSTVNGQKLVIIQGNTLIDDTGRPITGAP